jgi:hypothetical protein
LGLSKNSAGAVWHCLFHEPTPCFLDAVCDSRA